MIKGMEFISVKKQTLIVELFCIGVDTGWKPRVGIGWRKEPQSSCSSLTCWRKSGSSCNLNAEDSFCVCVHACVCIWVHARALWGGGRGKIYLWQDPMRIANSRQALQPGPGDLSLTLLPFSPTLIRVHVTCDFSMARAVRNKAQHLHFIKAASFFVSNFAFFVGPW